MFKLLIMRFIFIVLFLVSFGSAIMAKQFVLKCKVIDHYRMSIDRNFVLEQYWKANKKRLESMSELRRKVDAAIVLGENPKKIYKEFYDRGKGNLYIQMMKNRFVPFSSDMKWAHEKAFEEAREKGLPNPLDGNSKILAIMEKILSK